MQRARMLARFLSKPLPLRVSHRQAAAAWRGGARPERGVHQVSRVGVCCAAAQVEDYLALEDDQLWQQCRMETFRASGAGGQHRNKVDSAVRVIHEPTGTTATATEQRSQHENRRNAIKRLRSKIALKVRRETSFDEDFEIPEQLAVILPTRPKHKRIGQKHRDYPRGIQVLVDLLVANNFSVADTAKCLNLSTGALSRLITADNQLLSEVNQQRQAKGIRPLRKK